MFAAFIARLKAKVAAGGGFAIGSKPRFLSTHLRSTFMGLSVRHQTDHDGMAEKATVQP
jgi:hypothetical protein